MKGVRVILIVEDALDIQESLRELFEGEGYSVLCVSNGKEALGILRSGTSLPGLIFLDLTMPVMDGFAFRAEQMKDPRLAPIPVVVMTADPPSSAGQKLGVKGFIRKPADITTFLEMATLHFQIV